MHLHKWVGFKGQKWIPKPKIKPKCCKKQLTDEYLRSVWDLKNETLKFIRMENKSTNVENGITAQTDANTMLCVGCRVRLTRFDAEEGFPVVTTGVVSFDWEENYYRKQIDVKLDNGEIVSMIPKWSVEVIGNHA